MRFRTFHIYIILFLILSTSWATALTLKLSEVSIQEALKKVSIAADICVIAVSNLEGKVSLDVKAGNPFAVIYSLAQKCGYTTSYAEGHIYVGSKEALASYDMAQLVTFKELKDKTEKEVREALHKEHPYCTVIFDVKQKTFVVLLPLIRPGLDDLRNRSVAVLDEGRRTQRAPKVKTAPQQPQRETFIKSQVEEELKALKQKLKRYLKLIANHPRSAKGWIKISLGFHKLALYYNQAGDTGRYKRALTKSAKALNKAIKLNKRSVKLRSRMVLILCALNKFELARQQYAVVSKLSTKWATQLAYVYPQLSNPANSKEQVG